MAQTNRRTTQKHNNDYDFQSDHRRASVLTNAITNIGNRGTVIEKSGLTGPEPKPKWLFCEKKFTNRFSQRLVCFPESNRIYDEYEPKLLKDYMKQHSIVLRRCNADEADLRKYGREFERALEPLLLCEVVHLHRAMRIDFRTNFKFNTGKIFETALDDLMQRPQDWRDKNKNKKDGDEKNQKPDPNAHVPEQFTFQIEDHLGETISKMSINKNGPKMIYVTCAWCKNISFFYCHGPNLKVSLELNYTTERGKQKKVGKMMKVGGSFFLAQKVLGSKYTFCRPKGLELVANFDELRDSTDITFSVRFFEVDKPLGIKTNAKYAFTDLLVSNRSFDEFFENESQNYDSKNGIKSGSWFSRLLNRNSVGFI